MNKAQINEPGALTDEELSGIIASDPFNSHQPGDSIDALPPEEVEWHDPELASYVDEILTAPIDIEVEVYPSEHALALVSTAEQWLEAARATEPLLGAAPPIDVERIEDLRTKYDRAPACFSPEAADVRFLITALDTLGREHLMSLVELNRTVLRLEKQLKG